MPLIKRVRFLLFGDEELIHFITFGYLLTFLLDSFFLAFFLFLLDNFLLLFVSIWFLLFRQRKPKKRIALFTIRIRKRNEKASTFRTQYEIEIDEMNGNDTMCVCVYVVGRVKNSQ